MEDIFLARQPIYNRKLELVGYELLYRDNEQDLATFPNASDASSRLIINTFIGLGLENIVGSSPAFINLTDDFFISDQSIPMTSEQIVLELSGSRLPNESVMKGLQELSRKGYRIALDHFVYRHELKPLIELANIVKLDLAELDYQGITEQVKLCRQHKLQLLAEKVESQEDFTFCMDLGIDLFQGYFFCKPQLMRGRAEPANKAVILQLLDQLQKPDIDMYELEKVIVRDVALTYKLLRYLNCASYALRREIDSVRDALILIGTNTVKKWAVLLLMSSYADDKPKELITMAMVRAKMCELLADHFGISSTESAFTVGLFSTLDAVMDTPMEELLDTISLNTEIKFALLNQEGILGELLKQVLRYETGDWAKMDTQYTTPQNYARAYLDAVYWVSENSLT